MTSAPAIPSFRALTDRRVRIKAVNIGASDSDGHAPPYAALLEAGGVGVVGFEPNLKALAELNAHKGPCETYLPYAIGDGGRHTLNMCFAPGMTSLLKPNPAVLKLFPDFAGWARGSRARASHPKHLFRPGHASPAQAEPCRAQALSCLPRVGEGLSTEEVDTVR